MEDLLTAELHARNVDDFAIFDIAFKVLLETFGAEFVLAGQTEQVRRGDLFIADLTIDKLLG